ncbi:MAG: hypothetical protein ACE5Q6_09810 [Dehalococcoidia bacterium]
MVFSAITAPNATLDVKVNGEYFYPGDNLNVSVSLLPHESFHVRWGKVELVRSIRSYAVTSPQGGVSEQTFEEVLASKSIWSDAEMLTEIPYKCEVSFPIPKRSQPSIYGEVARVSWYCRVVIDVNRRADMQQTRKVVILAPAPANPAEGNRGSVPEEKAVDFGDFTLTLSFSTLTIRTGESVSGVLRTRLGQDIKAKAVRVQLVRSEKAGVRDFEKVEDRVIIGTPSTLFAGEAYESPLALR